MAKPAAATQEELPEEEEVHDAPPVAPEAPEAASSSFTPMRITDEEMQLIPRHRKEGLQPADIKAKITDYSHHFDPENGNLQNINHSTVRPFLHESAIDFPMLPGCEAKTAQAMLHSHASAQINELAPLEATQEEAISEFFDFGLAVQELWHSPPRRYGLLKPQLVHHWCASVVPRELLPPED